jgi:hypothetical protein
MVYLSLWTYHDRHHGDQIRATNRNIHLARNYIWFWTNQKLYDHAKVEMNGTKDKPFFHNELRKIYFWFIIRKKSINVGISGLLLYNLFDGWG